MISASVEEWLTAPCFLQIQFSGTNVRGQTRHNTPPVVDLESHVSPAKEASEYTASLRSGAGSPTVHLITQSLVVLM